MVKLCDGMTNLQSPLKHWDRVKNAKHLPQFLAEFSYRFNRCFELEDMLPRFAYIALRTPAMPIKLLSKTELYG